MQSINTISPKIIFDSLRISLSLVGELLVKILIPSHAVIASLTAQNSLVTVDKIIERGFYGPNWCILCKE